MIVLGIDPGQHNGLAIFNDGKLIDLKTVAPIDLNQSIRDVQPALVVFEDSRLQSTTFVRQANYAQMLKIARNVGMVDALCGLISDICIVDKIKAIPISPKDKGAKVNSERFKSITGWEKQSNQHCRDAAMIAWKFRSGARNASK